MRSVVVYLSDATEEEVAASLRQAYPYQPGPPWVDEVDGDSVLYIDFYRDGPQECEPEEWAQIVASVGSSPVAVTADVSGRHPGDEQALRFVISLLRRFGGVAQDDYTRHLWTQEELATGSTAEGHPFFDYGGWYDDGRRGAA